MTLLKLQKEMIKLHHDLQVSKAKILANFFVFVDKVVLTQTSSFSKAFLRCFFSHYLL